MPPAAGCDADTVGSRRTRVQASRAVVMVLALAAIAGGVGCSPRLSSVRRVELLDNTRGRQPASVLADVQIGEVAGRLILDAMKDRRPMAPHKCASSVTLVLYDAAGRSWSCGLHSGHDPKLVGCTVGGDMYTLDRAALVRALDAAGIKDPPLPE